MAILPFHRPEARAAEAASSANERRVKPRVNVNLRQLACRARKNRCTELGRCCHLTTFRRQNNDGNSSAYLALRLALAGAIAQTRKSAGWDLEKTRSEPAKAAPTREHAAEFSLSAVPVPLKGRPERMREAWRLPPLQPCSSCRSGACRDTHTGLQQAMAACPGGEGQAHLGAPYGALHNSCVVS